MDLLPVCVLIFLLSAPLNTGGEIECPCSEIPKWPHTKSPTEECHRQSRYRYSCQDGYVRKAGTSNLIKCKDNGGVPKWEEPTLDCIDDPKRPKHQTANATLTSEIECPCSEIPKCPHTKSTTEECHRQSRYRYSCQDGYVRKPGTSNLIKCKDNGGVPKWEEPTLDCIAQTSTSLQINQTTVITTTTIKATPHDDHKRPKLQTPNATLTTQTSTGLQINQTTGIPETTMKATPHDIVSPTTKKNETTDIYPNPAPEAQSGTAKAAILSVALFALVCASIGIGCFLHQRKTRNNTSQQPAEELERMNDPPPGLHE